MIESSRLMTPARTCLLLALLTVGLGWLTLANQTQLSLAAALQALFSPAHDDIAQVLAHYSWWPRLVISLLAGGGLALAGVLMQQVLRNPLAAPTTLGVASGANLGLLVATLAAPGLMEVGREWVALVGGGLAMGLVFLLAWRRGLSPVVVVLALVMVKFLSL